MPTSQHHMLQPVEVMSQRHVAFRYQRLGLVILAKMLSWLQARMMHVAAGE